MTEQDRTHRDGHRPKMLASFVDHLIGVLDTPDDAEAAMRALHAEGFTDQQLELLSGEEGETRLDYDGSRHGLLARYRRQIQHLTDEYAYAVQYEDALLRGQYLVVVEVRDSERAHRVCHLLKDCGGHFIKYFGQFVTESFGPDIYSGAEQAWGSRVPGQTRRIDLPRPSEGTTPRPSV